MVDWWFVAAQVIGVIGATIGLSAKWVRNRRSTIVRTSVACVFNGVQYLMLGLNGTAAISGLHVVRGLMLYRENKASWMRSRWTVLAMLAVYAIAYIALSGFPATWVFWLPLVATTMSTVALSMDDILHIKAFSVVGTAVWCLYELMVGAYGLLAGELVGLGLVIASFTIIVRGRRTHTNA